MVRLCDVVERSLAQRHKNEPLERLKERSRLIQLGHVSTSQMLVAPMDTANDFLDRLRELHNTMFAKGDVAIAGRFRKEGESATIDDGPHAFNGVPTREIETRLKTLFESDYAALCTTPHDKHAFSLRAAVFLVRFFDIHPFVDGNGRVARLLVFHAAELVGGWRFDARPSRGRQRRSYLKALRYARRDITDPTKMNNRFRHIAAWMERQLVEREQNDDPSEHEPDWLRDTRR